MTREQTAYENERAFSYDERRFGSSRGLLFDLIARQEFERSLSAVPTLHNALEVGCGSGRFLGLIKKYSPTVIGIDPSSDMISTAKYQDDEGTSLPFANGEMDFVCSIRTLNRVGSKDYSLQMIREIFRVCRSGNHLLLDFVNRDSLSRFNRHNSDIYLA